MHDISRIFQCRQCGHCCHGKTTVSLNERDLARLVRFLRLSRDEVFKRYLRVNGNTIQMQTVDGHCIFYTKTGCTVHPAKPWRCRQWPLHESILTDPANLSAIRDSCPGLDRNLSWKEFCAILAPIHAAADYEHD